MPGTVLGRVGAPYYPPMAPPTYPHRAGGIALFISGLVLFLIGVFSAAYCFGPTYGCTSYPYAGVGALIALFGFVLFIVGVILVVVRGEPHIAAPHPAIYFHPPPHPPPPPGAVPGYAMPGSAYAPPAAIVPAITVERYCPSCGAGNLRASAFCHRCGKPLPPT